jgi:hypothetical protein
MRPHHATDGASAGSSFMTKRSRFRLISAALFAGLLLQVGCPAFLARSYAATLPPVPAVSATAFLDSVGINTHIDQGYDPASYVEPFGYIGVRQVRDGARNVAAAIRLHQQTGVRFTINGGGNLDLLLSSARALAEANALLALEGANEPNNFEITYNGKKGGTAGGTWLPVAQFQQALYTAVKSDKVLRQYPVFGPSETGAQTDNVGLQFLTIPPGKDTLMPEGTRFADYANVHNYVIGNGNLYEDNQAWNAADPTLNERWDGLYGNHGVTWHKRYKGYSDQQLLTLPRVTTETGWDTTDNPGGQETQGAVLINTYLAQFKRGWAYTFVYELRDAEGSTGDQGIYHGMTPKLAATYLHNLTTILCDDRPVARPGSLPYMIQDRAKTVHDLLLQKSNGLFELVVWDDRVRATDVVTVDLGSPRKTIKVYDVTVGTAPVRILSQTDFVQLTLSGHAMIIEIGD